MFTRFDSGRLALVATLVAASPCLALGCSSDSADCGGSGGGSHHHPAHPDASSSSSGGSGGGGGTVIGSQSFGHGAAPTCALRLGPDDASDHLTPSSFMQPVAIAADGDAIVAGSFYGDLALPSGTLTSGGGWDVAIAKVDRKCHVVWAKRFGGPKDQNIDALAIDPTGGFVVAGNIYGSIDFGSGSIAGRSGPASDEGGALVVAKFDDDGNAVWAKGFGADQDGSVAGLVVDAAGTIFITGGFTSSLDLGTGALQTKHAGTRAGYLAALDPSGATIWSRGYGLAATHSGDSAASPSSLALDPSGDLWIGGAYHGTGVDFGGAVLPATTQDGQPFLARYSSAGDPVSSTSFPSLGAYAVLTSVDVDPAGDVLVAGAFEKSIQIGEKVFDDPATALPPTKKNTGEALPTFVARLSPSGQPRWIKFAGEEGSLCGVVFGGDSPIARFDAKGDVLVTGCFVGTLDLGGGALSVPDAFERDDLGGLFIAALDPNGQHLSSRVLGPDAASGWGIAPAPGGGAALTAGFVGDLDVNGTKLEVNGLPNTFLTWLTP